MATKRSFTSRYSRVVPGVAKAGQPWATTEDTQLLKELKENIDLESIAQTHERTPGAITARIRVLALKLYQNGTPIEEVSRQTKLAKSEILKTVDQNAKKEAYKKENKQLVEQIEDEEFVSILHADKNVAHTAKSVPPSSPFQKELEKLTIAIDLLNRKVDGLYDYLEIQLKET